MPIAQGHQCITSETTAFAQIRQHRSLVGAALHRAAELAEGHHRHVEFACQRLERAADKADLLLPILVAPVATTLAGHQLHVVDDDQIKAMFGIEATRLSTNIGDADRRGVVNKDTGVGQHVRRFQQDRPLFFVHGAQAQAMAVDGRLHRQ